MATASTASDDSISERFQLLSSYQNIMGPTKVLADHEEVPFQLSCPRYQPTPSKATTAGQDYEVGLCCLLLLRGQRLCSQFFLACNHGDAGLFDDVVFVYRRRETDVGWRAILVQQKHKEKKTIRLWARQTQVKPGSSKVPSDLAEYCKSFSEIKERWRRFKTDETSTVDIEHATYVFYSNSKVDLHGADRDVPTEDITELILTGGRAVKIDYGEVSQEVWGQQLPNSREFLDNFLLFYDQVDHKAMEKYLEEEINLLLDCKATAVTAIVAEVKVFIKEWWELKSNVPFIRENSNIWQKIITKEMAGLNKKISDNNFRFKLTFSEDSRYELHSWLQSCRKLCVLVKDQCHATMVALRMFQVEKSLIIESTTLEQNLGEVLALSMTSFCHVVIIVDGSSRLQDGILQKLVDSFANVTEKRLVIIRKQLVCGNGWTVREAPITWEILDWACKDRLLSASITLQGQTVALRDLVDSTSDRSIMSDVLIERFLGRLPDIVLGEEIPTVAADYLPRCIKRKTVECLSFLSSLKTDKVIIVMRGINKKEVAKRFGHDFIVSHYLDVKDYQSIYGATVVIGDPSASRIGRLCSKFHCRGFIIGSELDHLKYQVTEFHPSTWLINQKSVIVSGFPGIGKSSFVTWMCSQVKERFPEAWVIRVNMGNESDFINGREFESTQDLKAFLARSCYLEANSSLNQDFMNHALDVTGNVFIFLDAFDEISPDYTEKCCRLLKGIADSVKYRQLVVTTRPVTKRDVEDTLGSVAFYLPGFTGDEQRSFLTGFCQSRGKEVHVDQLHSVIEDVGAVLEVPLLCRMTAELILANKTVEHNYTKVALYESFVDRHVALYLTEKHCLKSSSPGVAKLLELYKRELTGQLEDLAVISLLSPEERVVLGFQSSGDALEDEKLGLVVCCDRRVDFVHRTFAEFFLGTWLAEHYRQCRQILTARLFRENCELMTDAFNCFLARRCRLHSAVAEGDLGAVEKLLGSLSSTGPGDRTPLHVAALSDKKIALIWRRLVDAGVPLDLEDGVLGWTAIECAEAVKNWEMVDFLLREGASASKLRTIKHKETARGILRAATTKGLVDLSLLIISLHQSLVNESLSVDGSTALHLAISSGNTHLVSELLSLGTGTDCSKYASRKDVAQIDVNRGDNSGDTALHWSCSAAANVEAVTLLLRHGADIDRANSSGVTALHMATSAGDTETVAQLLRHGADPRWADWDRNTALHWASGAAGGADTVALLIRHGADIARVNYNRDTALHWASSTGSAETVALLLQHGADVHAVNSNGVTALHWASSAGSAEKVRLLLRHGADINRAIGGDTALHWAASTGSNKTVALLVASGARVDRANKFGTRALHRACTEGNADTAALLLDLGADIGAVDREGDTALHRASSAGSAPTAALLLDRGADIGRANKYGSSPLHEAARAGSVEGVEVLLRHGARVNQTDKAGGTALHWASSAGSAEKVGLLLRHGADINRADRHGDTALHKAARDGNAETVQLLLRHGADVSKANGSGETALQGASSAGDTETMALLLRHVGP